MKQVEISVEKWGVALSENETLTLIGGIAGVCYGNLKNEEHRIKRALTCAQKGHHSPFEHVNITLKCIVDRGVSHALVRHRHCAFQQSSTIYQKYNELTFITPHAPSDSLLLVIENEYKELLKNHKPSEARDILPNCLATELVITTNIRQWQYMIHRRCGQGDSNNMHIWCEKVRQWFEERFPRITDAFDKWYAEHSI